MATPAVVLLVAALLAALAGPGRGDYAHNPLDPNLDWYKPYDFISFNVASGDYAGLLDDINNIVIQGSNNVAAQSVWVLHQQNLNDKKPFKWLILELVGSGDNKMMLAIRQDNLYINGFTDRFGNWFIFTNRPQDLIPVATVFRLADSYTELVDGYKSLKYVRVSKQTTMDAIERVANFAPMPSADVGHVSRALAIMAVNFAEASRFYPIGDLITQYWDAGADLGELHKLVIYWRVLSCALLISQQDGYSWNSPEAWDLSKNTRIKTIDNARVGHPQVGHLASERTLLAENNLAQVKTRGGGSAKAAGHVEVCCCCHQVVSLLSAFHVWM